MVAAATMDGTQAHSVRGKKEKMRSSQGAFALRAERGDHHGTAQERAHYSTDSPEIEKGLSNSGSAKSVGVLEYQGIGLFRGRFIRCLVR